MQIGGYPVSELILRWMTPPIRTARHLPADVIKTRQLLRRPQPALCNVFTSEALRRIQDLKSHSIKHLEKSFMFLWTTEFFISQYLFYFHFCPLVIVAMAQFNHENRKHSHNSFYFNSNHTLQAFSRGAICSQIHFCSLLSVFSV